MRVGPHKNSEKQTWNIGDMPIEECESYKYLGDQITPDGKSGKTIEDRKNKIFASTMTIKAIAAGEVLKKIETSVLLQLHDTVNLPGLLTNSETWNLLKGEKDELERIEIQAIKYLFDLPTHTPTPAIIFTFGTLYTSQRVEKKQLMYLWKILQRNSQHWTRQTLDQIVTLNIGWGKMIKECLNKYDLSNNFAIIASKSHAEWKREVEKQIEKINRERLIDQCYKTEDGQKKEKTKTARILPTITQDSYQRIPSKEILKCSQHETKTLMIARFGMLECGSNFQGTLNKNCSECNQKDDEHHRLNHCKRYRNLNNCDITEKLDFGLIYSDDMEVLRKIIPEIMKVWNIKTSYGTMNTE